MISRFMTERKSVCLCMWFSAESLGLVRFPGFQGSELYKFSEGLSCLPVRTILLSVS